jgi:hypothetical protein
MPSDESLFLRDLYASWLTRMDGMDLPTMQYPVVHVGRGDDL